MRGVGNRGSLQNIGVLFNYASAFRLPLWSSVEFLATDPEVPGSIPGTTRFSDK
jgi:hypothetical protein